MTSRKLTELAAFLAIYLLIIIIDTTTGGLIFDILLPLPIVVVALRHKLSDILIFCVAAMILTALIDPVLAIYHFLTAFGVGILYGHHFRKKQGIMSIALVTVTFACANILVFLIMAPVLGLPADEVLTLLRQQSFELGRLSKYQDFSIYSLVVTFYLIYSLFFAIVVLQLSVIVLTRLKMIKNYSLDIAHYPLLSYVTLVLAGVLILSGIACFLFMPVIYFILIIMPLTMLSLLISALIYCFKNLTLSRINRMQKTALIIGGVITFPITGLIGAITNISSRR